MGFVYVVSLNGVSKIGRSFSLGRSTEVAKKMFGPKSAAKIKNINCDHEEIIEKLCHKALASKIVPGAIYKNETFRVSHEKAVRVVLDCISSEEAALLIANKLKNARSTAESVTKYMNIESEHAKLYMETFDMCGGANLYHLIDAYSDSNEENIPDLLRIQIACLTTMLIDATETIAAQRELIQLKLDLLG